jgi:hypothetical protein
MDLREMKRAIKEYDEKKPFVFISYSSKDSERVYEDILELQNRGVNLWIDKEMETRAGEGWKEIAFPIMEKPLCKAILYYLSLNSITSGPVKQELAHRHAQKTIQRNGNKILKMIPIAVEKISDIRKWVFEDIYELFGNEEIKDYEYDNACDILTAEFNDNNDITRIARPEMDFDDYYDQIMANLINIDPRIVNYERKNVSNNSQKLELRMNKDDEGIVQSVELSPSKEQIEDKTVIIEKKQDQDNQISTVTNNAGRYIYNNAKPDGIKISSSTTLEEFRNMFMNNEFCLWIRGIREDKMTYSIPKQVFDYVMASALKGCDKNVEKGSFRWNYCVYVVQNSFDQNNPDLVTGQFTWSSNARKAANIKGSGKLGDNSVKFEKMSGKLTLAELMQKYIDSANEEFKTKNNDAAVKAIKTLIEA